MFCSSFIGADEINCEADKEGGMNLAEQFELSQKIVLFKHSKKYANWAEIHLYDENSWIRNPVTLVLWLTIYTELIGRNGVVFEITRILSNGKVLEW